MSSKGLKVSAPKKTKAQPELAPPAEATPAPAAKKTKSQPAPAAESAPAPAPPAEAQAAEAPASEGEHAEPASAEETLTVSQHLKALLAENLQELIRVKKNSIYLKQLIKAHESELKSFKSTKKVKRASNPDRPPSGIHKPVTVSDVMYKFLEPYGIKNGDLISKTIVLKHINAHVREHNLQNPEFRKAFKLDATLEPLFVKIPEGEMYLYTKIMAHTRDHFKSAEDEPAAAADPGKSVKI